MKRDDGGTRKEGKCLHNFLPLLLTICSCNALSYPFDSCESSRLHTNGRVNDYVLATILWFNSFAPQRAVNVNQNICVCVKRGTSLNLQQEYHSVLWEKSYLTNVQVVQKSFQGERIAKAKSTFTCLPSCRNVSVSSDNNCVWWWWMYPDYIYKMVRCEVPVPFDRNSGISLQNH